MTAVILPQAGYLIAIREPGQVTPGLLTVDGLNSTTADILISSFSQRAQVAHQVTQTIGGPEYVYVFGDVLQDLNVGIIVYPKGCAERANSYLTAWKFYDEQRLQPGKVSIVNLTFAGLNLRGLVVAFQADSDAAAGTAVIRGTLILKGWSVTESN